MRTGTKRPSLFCLPKELKSLSLPVTTRGTWQITNHRKLVPPLENQAGFSLKASSGVYLLSCKELSPCDKTFQRSKKGGAGGGNPSQKGKSCSHPTPTPSQRVCADRHLPATLGSEGVDSVGTGVLNISAMNAIVPITPSPTAHATRWVAEVCSSQLSNLPGLSGDGRCSPSPGSDRSCH